MLYIGSMLATGRFALGCAPLGGLFRSVSEAAARETVDAAWEAGIRTFDVAPQYGVGRAERRLGAALRPRPRDEFVLSTKVGRLVVDHGDGQSTEQFAGTSGELRYDFSRDGVLRSLDESLERLGLDRVDIVHVHDPDAHLDEAIAHALPALAELREQGVIGAIGAGMNHAEPLERIVAETDVDCVLLAGRYTLLDHDPPADALLARCADRDVAVFAAGVFNSGVLADPRADARFDYAQASGRVLARARAMALVCGRHGVPLTAAAMRFPLRHPAVRTVIVGARSAQEVRANATAFAAAIPEDLWEALTARNLTA